MIAAVVLPLEAGQEAAFWTFGVTAILGALGLVLFRKAVYAALSMMVTMLSVAALYAALDAPFLFAAQIIVYTGAIMMLFIFVMRMVGVDTPDSAIEVIKGQRVLALLAGLGLAGLLVAAIVGTVTQPAVGLAEANAEFGGTVEGIAALMFNRYVFAFEFTSGLLITAAIAAMVLAHPHRVTARKTQAQMADDRMRAYATRGEHPGSLPNSGVYATHNSIGAPALLPDGSIAEKSVSQTLVMRGATLDPTEPMALTADRFAAIQSAKEDDES